MKIDRNVVTLIVLVLTILYIYIVAITTPTKFTDNPVLQRRAYDVCDSKNVLAITTKKTMNVGEYDSALVEELSNSLRNSSHEPDEAWKNRKSLKVFVDSLAKASKQTNAYVGGTPLYNLHHFGVFISKQEDMSLKDIVRLSIVHGRYLAPFVHGISWGPYVTATSSTPKFQVFSDKNTCTLSPSLSRALESTSKRIKIKDVISSSLLVSHGIGHAAALLSLQDLSRDVSISSATQCMYAICSQILKSQKAQLFGCMHGAYMVLKDLGPFLEPFLDTIKVNSLAHVLTSNNSTRISREFWHREDCCSESPAKAACEMWRSLPNKTSCCVDEPCAFGNGRTCQNITTPTVLLASVAGTSFTASLLMYQRVDDLNVARTEMIRLCESPFNNYAHLRFGALPVSRDAIHRLHSRARGACLSAASLVLGEIYYYHGDASSLLNQYRNGEEVYDEKKMQ